ncbi:hypothetical protein OXX80_000011 [Metschnikowia pulcherrima]
MTQYAVITGAGTGIGAALAVELHSRGYTIIGISPDFDMANMEPLTTQIGLIPIQCDITDTFQVKDAATKVKMISGGKIDILYNNAGICPLGGPLIDADDDLLKRIFEVNVLGHMHVTKYFSEMVINARGTIVFTSSVAGRVPLSWAGAYCATKAAIDQYALVLHGEMKPLGVRVHSVITGGVNTAIADHAEPPTLSRFYNTKDVEESLLACRDMSRNPRTSVAPAQYARDVCNKICRKRDYGFNIYGGFAGYLLHLFRWYCPLWLVEYGVQRHFKQDRAFRSVQHRRQQEESKKES